jgi:phosphomevalonate kinase
MGRSAAFLVTVHAFCEALEDLGTRAEIPVLSDDHRQLRRLAEEAGATYKPSGAGGGDFGLVFATDPETVSAVAIRASTSGFEVMDLSVETTGLASESSSNGSRPDGCGAL